MKVEEYGVPLAACPPVRVMKSTGRQAASGTRSTLPLVPTLRVGMHTLLRETPRRLCGVFLNAEAQRTLRSAEGKADTQAVTDKG